MQQQIAQLRVAAERQEQVQAQILAQRQAQATVAPAAGSVGPPDAVPAEIAEAGGGGALLDTRLLRGLERCDGTSKQWRDWRAIARSYFSCIYAKLQNQMFLAETDSQLDCWLGVQEAGNTLESRKLYTRLLHSSEGAALDRIIHAGPGEGLLVWKDLVKRFEPRQRTRQAGLLQALMAWSFAGDSLERLEAWEREVTRGEQLSGQKLADERKTGLVIEQLDENDSKKHLIYNADRLTGWCDFRAEVVNARLVLSTADQGLVATDVGGLDWGGYEADDGEGHEELDAFGKSKKGGGKGAKGGKGSVTKFMGNCYKCGKPGHQGAEGRGGGQSKGSGNKGKSSKGRRERDASSAAGDHYARKYPKRQHGARSLEDGSTESAPHHAQERQQEPGAGANGHLGGLFITALNDRNEVSELKAVNEVLRGGRKVRCRVDSGAAATVTRSMECSDYPRNRKQKKVFRTASKVALETEGRRTLGLADGCFVKADVVADLSKNLIAVAYLCDSGHRVVFDNDKGYLAVHKKTGRKTVFQRSGNVADTELEVVTFTQAQNVGSLETAGGQAAAMAGRRWQPFR